MIPHFVVLLGVHAILVNGQYHTYHCEPGRDVIVHLFEWRWDDIANECETFLGPNGFCGVQTAQPMEHRIVTDPPYPWWQRYQPVSYNMTSRSGDEAAFRDMVTRCNNAGVRIFIDAVINHMTKDGGSGEGTYGSPFDGTAYSYPGVPYDSSHFNLHFGSTPSCPTSDGNIWDYNDPVQCRNCMLDGLRDLRLELPYVREKIATYLNKLIGWGVAGFRMDTAKHMWPADESAIWSMLDDLNTQWFPAGTRPYFFLEIIHLGSDQGWIPDYVPSLGRHNEFRYGTNLGDVIMKRNGQMMTYLKNFGNGWGFTTDVYALAFLSNHDNQRGHGGGGDSVLTFWDPKTYKMGHVFMLGYEYGHIRIMSSYYWERDIQPDGHDANDYMGPPSDANGNTLPVTCFQNPGWVCEHRWRQVTNMVRFHNVAMGYRVTRWWDNGANLISFARGVEGGASVGFVVINNEDVTHDRFYDTGMPAGVYCDVTKCDSNVPPCVGDGACREITVDASGWANISIGPFSSTEDPYVAIHV